MPDQDPDKFGGFWRPMPDFIRTIEGRTEGRSDHVSGHSPERKLKA